MATETFEQGDFVRVKSSASVRRCVANSPREYRIGRSLLAHWPDGKNIDLLRARCSEEIAEVESGARVPNASGVSHFPKRDSLRHPAQKARFKIAPGEFWGQRRVIRGAPYKCCESFVAFDRKN